MEQGMLGTLYQKYLVSYLDTMQPIDASGITSLDKDALASFMYRYNWGKISPRDWEARALFAGVRGAADARQKKDPLTKEDFVELLSHVIDQNAQAECVDQMKKQKELEAEALAAAMAELFAKQKQQSHDKKMIAWRATTNRIVHFPRLLCRFGDKTMRATWQKIRPRRRR